MTIQIGMLLFPNITQLDFTGPYEVLSRMPDTTITIIAATNAPATILHVVTVQWKADSTPAQQQAAIDGLRKMAADVPGIKSIWIKKLKVQPAEFSTVFAIEFESNAAFEAYTNHPAHMWPQ